MAYSSSASLLPGSFSSTASCSSPSSRRAQARTVTARNKPLGHVEPNWCQDQVNGTGAYANLTDSQMRSWNRDPKAPTTAVSSQGDAQKGALN